MSLKNNNQLRNLSQECKMQNQNAGNIVPKSIVYDEILVKIGYGKAQWILLLISGLLTITSLDIVMSMTFIILATNCEFATTQVDKVLMLSAPKAGIFLSCYVLGHASDVFGRRIVLLYGTFISNALYIVLLFVTKAWLFNTINFLSGIAIGGVSGALYAYLSEFNTSRHQALTINYSLMFVSISAIYLPATAWLVMSSNWSFNIIGDFVFRPWRLIILLTLLPGFIGAVMLLYYPESPKFLLSQNKVKQAMDAINWISRVNRGIPFEHDLDYDLILNNEVDVKTPKERNFFLSTIYDIVSLFKKPHGLKFILYFLAVQCMFFGSGGLRMWFPDIVNRAFQIQNNNSSTLCELIDISFKEQDHIVAQNTTENCSENITNETYIYNILSGLVSLLGFLIQGVLLNSMGRKSVLLGGLIISTISRIFLNFVSNTMIVLILFCLSVIWPSVLVSIVLVAVVDLVPTNLRGKATSFCLSFARLMTTVSTGISGMLIRSNCNAAFALETSIMIACIVIICSVSMKFSG